MSRLDPLEAHLIETTASAGARFANTHEADAVRQELETWGLLRRLELVSMRRRADPWCAVLHVERRADQF